MREFLTGIFGPLDPEQARSYAAMIQIAAMALFVAAAWIFRKTKGDGSAFRATEAEIRAGRAPRPGSPDAFVRSGKDPLGKAKLEGPPPGRGPAQPSQPLRLTGIRIDGPAHEILGIAPGATQEQVQKSYRDLMKRYHPDVVGRQGTREWQDAQRIAEAINRAKNEMLARIQASQSQSPKRSGR